MKVQVDGQRVRLVENERALVPIGHSHRASFSKRDCHAGERPLVLIQEARASKVRQLIALWRDGPAVQAVDSNDLMRGRKDCASPCPSATALPASRWRSGETCSMYAVNLRSWSRSASVCTCERRRTMVSLKVAANRPISSRDVIGTSADKSPRPTRVAASIRWVSGLVTRRANRAAAAVASAAMAAKTSRREFPARVAAGGDDRLIHAHVDHTQSARRASEPQHR